MKCILLFPDQQETILIWNNCYSWNYCSLIFFHFRSQIWHEEYSTTRMLKSNPTHFIRIINIFCGDSIFFSKTRTDSILSCNASSQIFEKHELYSKAIDTFDVSLLYKMFFTSLRKEWVAQFQSFRPYPAGQSSTVTITFYSFGSIGGGISGIVDLACAVVPAVR